MSNAKIVESFTDTAAARLEIETLPSGSFEVWFFGPNGALVNPNRLTPTMARALVLALAPLVGVFAAEQPEIVGNGDGKGYPPPANALKATPGNVQRVRAEMTGRSPEGT